MRKTWPKAALACVFVFVVGGLSAQQAPGPTPEAAEDDAPTSKSDAKTQSKAEAKEAAADGGLAARQEQVAERFRELERLLLRMAELTAPTDPRRAALLRQAVAQSKQRDIDHQFEQLVELLRQQRLAAVVKNQGDVQQDLAKLLELLLSEDRTKRIESEKERVREYLKRVNKIIKEQKAIQGETARGGDPRKLAGQQGELSDKTLELASDLEHDAGKKAKAENAEQEGQKEDEPNGDKQDGDKKDDAKKNGDKKDRDKKDSESSDPKSEVPNDDGKPGPSDSKPGDAPDKKDKKNRKDKNDQKDKADKPSAEKPAGDKSDAKKADKPQRDKPHKDDQDNEGKPDGAPQSDPKDQQPGGAEAQPGAPSGQQDLPAQKRLEQAQKRMKEAEKKLEEAKRTEATEKQVEAIKELEQAKADLEEILRQLREEEMSRTLAMLESRFRKMLDLQLEVYEGTKRVDKVPQAQRDRDDEIEAGRLGRKEAEISTQAAKALEVLREEGSAVAFPEAVTEMRDDMDQVVRRLSAAKVGDVTQGIEKDIIVALEEMIAALQKAQKDMDNKSKPGEPAAGSDDEPPLVDTLSELKMIRALQMRVNVRTGRYAAMSKSEQTDTPELLDALKGLAEREQRIHKVTRDIVLGRNR